MSYKPGFYYLNAITNQLIWRPLVVIEEDPDFMREPHIWRSWIVHFEDQYELMIKEVDELVIERILEKERQKRGAVVQRENASFAS